MMLIVRDKLGCVPLSQPVSHVGIASSDLWVTVPKNVLDQSQVLGFMVQVSAATMAEHMTGIARVLQVAGLQGLVHYGSDAISGYAAQIVSIRRRKYQRRENAVFFYCMVGWDSLQVFLDKLEGLLARIDRLHSALGALAPHHNGIGFPIDVFHTKKNSTY